jgi:hypothetical protein
MALENQVAKRKFVPRKQGGQIGRIFAQWAIVYSCSLFEISKVAQMFLLLFNTVQFYVLILTNSGLGSSGHTA